MGWRDYAAMSGRGALIYIFEADHGIKIGITRWADAGPRKLDLERAAGRELTLVRVWLFKDYTFARVVERAAHRALAADRLIGEWFCTHPLLAVDAVERIVHSPLYEAIAAVESDAA